MLDLNALIHEMEPLLRAQAPAGVRCQITYLDQAITVGSAAGILTTGPEQIEEPDLNTMKDILVLSKPCKKADLLQGMQRLLYITPVSA